MSIDFFLLAFGCLFPVAHTFSGGAASTLRRAPGSVRCPAGALGIGNLGFVGAEGRDRRSVALRAGPFDFLGGGDPKSKAAGEDEQAPVQDDPRYAQAPPSPVLPVAIVQGERGQRGGFRVDYKSVLGAIARASQDAAAEGVLMQQIEFPLDAVDQGTTLVKRYEALLSLSERLAQLLGLEGVRSIGEHISIRDNINPGGGGEYLDNEGLFGLAGQSRDGQPVALVMLAGLDTDDLQQLEKTRRHVSDQNGAVYSSNAGGLGLAEDSRVLLINTGLDRVTANQGFMGFGAASPFLKSFEPVYYAKQIGVGFFFRDYSFRELGSCDDSGERFDVGSLMVHPPAYPMDGGWNYESKILLWEAEQQIKALCRS